MTEYIVMREWTSLKKQQTRRLAAGPFSSRAKAETFARKAREEWANVNVVPLRPAVRGEALDT